MKVLMCAFLSVVFMLVWVTHAQTTVVAAPAYCYAPTGIEIFGDFYSPPNATKQQYVTMYPLKDLLICATIERWEHIKQSFNQSSTLFVKYED